MKIKRKENCLLIKRSKSYFLSVSFLPNCLLYLLIKPGLNFLPNCLRIFLDIVTDESRPFVDIKLHLRNKILKFFYILKLYKNTKTH